MNERIENALGVLRGLTTNEFSHVIMESVRERLNIKENVVNNSSVVGGGDYVDLGLSVKWAKCNIGAISEEEYGEYFTSSSARKLFKKREDRLPTMDEFEELLNGTVKEVVEINGIKGTKFTSKINNNYIFIPFAGYGYYGSLYSVGRYSNLWSSSISDSDNAWRLYCNSNGSRYMYDYYGRYDGCSVRGVSE